MIEAYLERRHERYGLAVYTAWHVVAFSRQEQLPERSELMERISRSGTSEQDPEEQMAVARVIHLMFADGVSKD